MEDGTLGFHMARPVLYHKLHPQVLILCLTLSLSMHVFVCYCFWEAAAHI